MGTCLCDLRSEDVFGDEIGGRRRVSSFLGLVRGVRSERTPAPWVHTRRQSRWVHSLSVTFGRGLELESSNFSLFSHGNARRTEVMQRHLYVLPVLFHACSSHQLTNSHRVISPITSHQHNLLWACLLWFQSLPRFLVVISAGVFPLLFGVFPIVISLTFSNTVLLFHTVILSPLVKVSSFPRARDQNHLTVLLGRLKPSPFRSSQSSSTASRRLRFLLLSLGFHRVLSLFPSFLQQLPLEILISYAYLPSKLKLFQILLHFSHFLLKSHLFLVHVIQTIGPCFWVV